MLKRFYKNNTNPIIIKSVKTKNKENLIEPRTYEHIPRGFTYGTCDEELDEMELPY